MFFQYVQDHKIVYKVYLFPSIIFLNMIFCVNSIVLVVHVCVCVYVSTRVRVCVLKNLKPKTGGKGQNEP